MHWLLINLLSALFALSYYIHHQRNPRKVKLTPRTADELYEAPRVCQTDREGRGATDMRDLYCCMAGRRAS